MKSFVYLDHTAEVKFKTYGKNLEECFVNCVYAVINLLTDYTKIKKKIKKKINIRAKDAKSLLYDFVNKIIYLIDVDGFVPREITNVKISKDFRLTGTFIGDHYKNYEMHGHIKAATYYDMKIKKNRKGYEIIMVLDV